MKTLHSGSLIIALLFICGCVSSPQSLEKPVGKGYLDLCTSAPAAGNGKETGIVLQDFPGEGGGKGMQSIVERYPACLNSTVAIWGDTTSGTEEWSHVTLQTNDGRSFTGWLPASRIMKRSDENGTEWSEGYTAIVGSWDRAGQGNGARIWYEFQTDGTFTFNYDMRGNRDNVQDKGSWRYLGNNTWDLISNMSDDHGHMSIFLDMGGKSFTSGTVSSSAVNLTQRDLSPASGTVSSFDLPVESPITYVKV